MQVASAQSFSPFGGGVAESTAHPQSIAILGVAAVLILLLPRKYVIVPLLLAVFLVPMGNVLVVGGVHLTPERILVLAGGLRVFWKKFCSKTMSLSGGWNKIDTAVLCWAGYRALAPVLLWRQSQAAINEFGFLWSVLGMYLLLRFLIRDLEDIQRTVKLFVLIAVINGAGMAYEHFTRVNLFGISLGGVSPFSDMRERTIRSQGSFAMSILAGTFGATLLPLAFWLWRSGRGKAAAVAYFAAGTVMVATTGSSTPLLAYVAAIFGTCLWPLRGRMRQVRWGIVGTLVGLQLVMKSPIWFLLNHVNVFGASSGYGRAMLIDNFVRHFHEWWLLGTKSTAEWGWDMYDLCDQFVAEGAVGGLATLIFFILIIKRAFGALGTARREAAGNRPQESLLWSLGVALFAFIVAFFGISLWDQTQVAWLALFAMISAGCFSSTLRRGTDDETRVTDCHSAADEPSGVAHA